MTSILPENRPGAPAGALVVRDGDGNRLIPTTVNGASVYSPPPEFAFSSPQTALQGECMGQVTPDQVNAIVSELIALCVLWAPDRVFDTASVTNLAAAFAVWAANMLATVDAAATAAAAAGPCQVITASDAHLTIDYSAGRYVRLTLAADVTSITVTHWPAAGRWATMFLDVINPAGHILSGWPAGTLWAQGGGAPVLGAGRHIVSLATSSGGSDILGLVPGMNFA